MTETDDTFEVIHTRVPVAGDYAQAVRLGDVLFVSGQVAVDEDGQLVGPDDIEAQTRQVFANLRTVLESGGSSLDRIAKITVLLTRREFRETIVAVRRELFGPLGHYPASTFAVISSLALPEWLVEIEAIAHVTPSPHHDSGSIR